MLARRRNAGTVTSTRRHRPALNLSPAPSRRDALGQPLARPAIADSTRR
jgi:hypothetical protein